MAPTDAGTFRAPCVTAVPADLLDHYGNAMNGLRPLILPRSAGLIAAGRVLERAGTFSDRPPGTAFWYENSNGLAEIAVTQGRADYELDLAIRSPIEGVQ